MKFGLVGERLGHSFSPEIHRALGNPDYTLIELAPDAVRDFFAKRDFEGVNVTIPYKETVMPFLDEISPEALAIGAVNTVRRRGGKLYGTNTDFGGMQALFAHAGIDLCGKKVLILGTGGTSKTARAVARAAGAREIVLVSREKKEGVVTYAEAYEKHADAEVIFNATPVGMFPHAENCPIDIARFPALCGVADAIYNPLCTRLVLASRAQGIPAEGGLFMLVAQAVLAAEIFLDTTFGKETTERLFRSILADKQNIVLTGMPASGKSTVGKLLSARLGRPFFDSDAEVEKAAGMPISKIFAKYGEADFRARENAALTALSAKVGAVIATGGGAILRDDNVDLLRANGKIYFLDRAPELLLATPDRPLSSTREAVFRRYAERIDRYRATADCIVPGDGTPESVVTLIEKEHFQ